MPKCRNCMLNALHKEDGNQFSWCLAKLDNFDIDEPRDCDLFIPVTNADKIRAMSDEELANWIGFVAQDAYLMGRGQRERMLIHPFDTREGTEAWLKQEVSDGN